jgi:hypothetical protein
MQLLFVDEVTSPAAQHSCNDSENCITHTYQLGQVPTTGACGIHKNVEQRNSNLNQFELLYVVLCAVSKGLANGCYASTLHESTAAAFCCLLLLRGAAACIVSS